MKILIKISILILVLASFNVVNAEYHNGTIEYNVFTDSSAACVSGTGSGVDTSALAHTSIYFGLESVAGNPHKLKFTDCHVTSSYDFEDLPVSTGGFFLFDDIPGYGGSMYFTKTTDGFADIYLYLDEDIPYTEETEYDITIDMSVINFYYDMYYVTTNSNYVASHKATGAYFAPYPNEQWTIGWADTFYYTKSGTFKNDYSIKFEGITGSTTVNRNVGGVFYSSDFIIENPDGSTQYNSGYVDTNNTYNHGNYTYNYYLKTQVDGLEFLLYQGIGEDAGPEDVLGLTTDRDIYHEDDEIVFNYTKLNEISDNDIIYDLITYAYDGNRDIQILTGLRLDGGYDQNTGQAWFATINYPFGEIYYGVIDHTISYRGNDNALTTNLHLLDSVTILPQDGSEYIELTGTKNSYINNDLIYFSYYSKSNVTITILDNESTILTRYLNISGIGDNSFIIPVDNDRVYDYPSWSIVMNNSYDNFTVYWIEQQAEEYNPNIDYEVNATVQENVDELKDGVKPIMDLIIGVSTIFLDNPDYDKNGIVDIEEMSNWFNGLVSILLVIVVYIFYKGLKRN